MNAIVEFLQGIVSVGQGQVLIYFILANLVLGTVAALVKKEFELARFADFGKRVLVVFGTYLGVAIASLAIADYSALRDVCWGALIAYMGTQILDNLRTIGILPIPEKVNRFIERK